MLLLENLIYLHINIVFYLKILYRKYYSWADIKRHFMWHYITRVLDLQDVYETTKYFGNVIFKSLKLFHNKIFFDLYATNLGYFNKKINSHTLSFPITFG